MSTDALNTALDGVERVLLDSSVLMAYHSPHEATHPLAHHLLTRIEDGHDPIHGYCSVMSAMELLIRPVRAGG